MNTFDPEAVSTSDSEPLLPQLVGDISCAFYRINEPSVIYQTFDQEVVAVHLNTGSYHTLPGIAGEVFLLLGATGSSAKQIAADLTYRYDAEAAAIEHDLNIFLGQLLEQSMIVTIGAPSSAVRVPQPSELKRASYVAPRLESYSDLEGLVLIDPVHDVDAAGWPNVSSDLPHEVLLETSEECVLPRMRCRIAGPNVIFERFNSETVAMDLGTGAYHSLSGAAEDIFLLFPNEPTTWEIRNALARKYAVQTAELESALRDYLNQLVQEGLIVLEKLDVKANEDLAEEAVERELQLSDIGSGKPFQRPTLETFAQPSFDGSFSEQMRFSHEQPVGVQIEDESERNRAAEPYAKRRYSIRTGDLIYSNAVSETVICDRDEGKYFKLNEAASDVFHLLADKPNVSEVVSALKQKYAVREQDLRVSAMILLWNLRKVGLATLERGDADPPASGEQEGQAAVQVAKATPELVPFNGFDVAMHHDLRDLLRPFNATYGTHAKPKAFHARQFMTLLEHYFEEAASACGSSEESFEVAGQLLTIRCAGGAHSEELRTAFQHLKTSSESRRNGHGLTISVWHNGSAAAGPFLDAWLTRLYENWSIVCGPRGEVLDFNCEEISVIYHPGPDVLSVLDRETGRAFYLLRDDAPLPFWELSSPFRHILHPWFDAHGLQYTHAGAVGTPNGGVLLAGRGGSGKSTTCLHCASAGMLYAADDYCLTRSEDGQVFSLYNTAKLKGPEDLERLPEMSGRSFNEDSFEHGGVGKATFNLSELWPERMTAGFPLRAILLPTVTDKVESRLVPCSPADALLALAPSTVAQLPFSGEADCLRLAALAEKVPAYRLFLGSDLSQIPTLISTLTGEPVG
jgi:Coenzyme PQQ synthesis protein D (PqqD)